MTNPKAIYDLVHRKTIELIQELGFLEGQAVEVVVQAVISASTYGILRPAGVLANEGAKRGRGRNGVGTLIHIRARTLGLNGQQSTDFDFMTTDNFGIGTYTLIQVGSITGSLGTDTTRTIDGLPATLAVQGGDMVVTLRSSLLLWPC
jgi:hypothetical protein